MAESKSELVAAEHGFVTRRLPAPGGWLYVTRTVVRNNYGSNTPEPTITVATTFVPDPRMDHPSLEAI